jgi:hypothetical protein
MASERLIVQHVTHKHSPMHGKGSADRARAVPARDRGSWRGRLSTGAWCGEGRLGAAPPRPPAAWPPQGRFRRTADQRQAQGPWLSPTRAQLRWSVGAHWPPRLRSCVCLLERRRCAPARCVRRPACPGGLVRASACTAGHAKHSWVPSIWLPPHLQTHAVGHGPISVRHSGRSWCAHIAGPARAYASPCTPHC